MKKKIYVFSDICPLPEEEKMAAIAALLTERDQDYVSLADLRCANVQHMPMRESFVETFGKGCREKTKHALQYVMPCNVRYSCILDRVALLFNKDTQSFTGWTYIAGQDYRQEIAQARKALIG